MGTTPVPRRLAIWDPAALDDAGAGALLRALAIPEWPFDAVQFRFRPEAGPTPDRGRVKGLAAAVLAAGRGLWINRDLALARAVGATGLQLGSEAALSDAEAAADAGLGLGISIHDAAEARRLAGMAPTFFLFGNVFETASKPGLPGRGLDALGATVAAAGGIPVLAVGGIDAERADACRQAGAAGWAAIRAAFGKTGSHPARP